MSNQSKRYSNLVRIATELDSASGRSKRSVEAMTLITACAVFATPAPPQTNRSELEYNLATIAAASPTTRHCRRIFDRAARVYGLLAKAALNILDGDDPTCHLDHIDEELAAWAAKITDRGDS